MAKYYYTKRCIQDAALRMRIEKFGYHVLLIAGPVSLKKTVRINATTIP